MRRVNLPEDLEEPNDAFFNHQLVELILKQAETQIAINWHDCYGPQNENIYFNLRQITNTLLFKGAKGYFWLILPPDINEILETYLPKKYVSVPMEQLPLGYNCVLFTGTFDKRWRMYTDPLLTDTIVIGATFSKKSPAFYATLKLEGYGKPREDKTDREAAAKALMDGFFPNG